MLQEEGKKKPLLFYVVHGIAVVESGSNQPAHHKSLPLDLLRYNSASALHYYLLDTAKITPCLICIMRLDATFLHSNL
jgi:hypothetical protein